MVTEKDNKAQIRLGNWQVFLMERLNTLYGKSTLCDVTLKFNDDQNTIQVHKVILAASTNCFDPMLSTPGVVVLQLPHSLKYNHVRPIINFMYTGKLEYLAEDYSQVFMAAKHFSMSVLLDIMKKHHYLSKRDDTSKVYKKYIHKYSSAEQPALLPNPVTEEPSPTRPSPHLDNTPSRLVPGKKLPFWKKRKTIQLPDEFYHSVNKKPPQPPELPRPTRFEWPDDEILPDVSLSHVDTFESLSYDSKVIIKPVDTPKPIISEDSIEKVPEMTKLIHISKRPRLSEVVKDHDDDEDYDDSHFESIHDLEEDLEEEEDGKTITTELKSVNTPPKPILKSHDTTTPPSSKKVRFSFSENIPNSETQTTPCAIESPLAQTLPTTPNTPIGTNISALPLTGNKSVNHAKIISEILKKYPDLVKNNKNIKLKIQSGSLPGSPEQNTVTIDKDGKGQTKVQYVVLKSEIASAMKKEKESKSDIVAGVENRTGPWTCVPCGDSSGSMNFESYYDYRKHLTGVHNERIDARICEHCGFKASKRNLHLYHLYTKHDIPPPRNINFPKCDQCNYIALSESLLIKHRSNHTGISREFCCKLCNAAFKSNGALMGHMQTNLHHVDQAPKKDYECEFCGKIFNRNINLKAHIRTIHQEENRKMYEDDEERTDDPAESEVIKQKNQNVMEVIEVPVFDSVQGNNKTLYLPQGMTILAESPAVPLMPSSESEAMSNVATGIATSINIADRNIPNDVIVIDANSEIILRGAPTYVVNQGASYSVQEYIVPEIMSDTRQVYTTALVSTAPTTGISYVTSDNLSIITSPTDHTYADGMKINGHIDQNAQVSLVSTSGQTVIASPVQVSQTDQPIIMQEPIIMNAEWMQSIGTSQPRTLSLGQGQKVEIISGPSVAHLNNTVQVSHESEMNNQVQVSCPVQNEPPPRTAQNLVNDWGDLEDDNPEDDSQDEEDSEMKPSRPTIELAETSEMSM